MKTVVEVFSIMAAYFVQFTIKRPVLKYIIKLK